MAQLRTIGVDKLERILNLMHCPGFAIILLYKYDIGIIYYVNEGYILLYLPMFLVPSLCSNPPHINNDYYFVTELFFNQNCKH